MFRTDADRIRFLLEAEAELCAFLADEALEAEAGDERPKYITNYILLRARLRRTGRVETEADRLALEEHAG